MEDRFPWMKKRKMSPQPVVMGVPRMQGELNEDQAVQWLITTLKVGQRLSLAKPAERLSGWYQGFCRGKKARTKTEL